MVLNNLVNWDGNTNSVIIGITLGESVCFSDAIKPYQTEGRYVLVDNTEGNYISISGVKYYHGIMNDSRSNYNNAAWDVW